MEEITAGVYKVGDLTFQSEQVLDYTLYPQCNPLETSVTAVLSGEFHAKLHQILVGLVPETEVNSLVVWHQKNFPNFAHQNFIEFLNACNIWFIF